MYRFLLTRQWVGLTLVCLLLIPVMVRLGFWQLHRHETRVAHNEQISGSLDARTAPIDELTSPGHTVPGSDRYRPVAATGRYDTEHEVVVRQRTGAEDDRIGYHVLTPLVRADGSAVLVNRGWIPPGDDLTSFPDVPAAPRGEITVTGLLLPDETTADTGIKERSGLPDRQVMLINGESVDLDQSLLGGYLQLRETSPRPSGDQPEMLSEPDHGSIGPHLAYAFNWWLMAAGVPIGWVVLFRRERRDQITAREARASASSESAAGPVSAEPDSSEPDSSEPDSSEPDGPSEREDAPSSAGSRAGRVPEGTGS